VQHFGHLGLNCYYQGVKQADLAFGKQGTQLGVQAWAQHGWVKACQCS
jgi:hypothetical protein